MKIQSLSIVVPNKTCINNCPFCVSKMHCEDYKNQLDENLPFFDLYLNDYLKRLQFARDNNCNTVMLTGTSEPQQNKKFLTYFGMMNRMLKSPFQWVEMQTTGILLDENYLRFLRNHVGVNLISLSICSLNYLTNYELISGNRQGFEKILNYITLSELIKKYDFTLRYSINLTKEFEVYKDKVDSLFKMLKNYGVDQVTFRVLYNANDGSPQSKWVEKNKVSNETINAICLYIIQNGVEIGTLPYGATKYSVNGICVVIDKDCMAKEQSHELETYKYLILRPDCKLYSNWDDKASLVF